MSEYWATAGDAPADGNRRKAAEILGIGLKTLYRKIQEFGLQ